MSDAEIKNEIARMKNEQEKLLKQYKCVRKFMRYKQDAFLLEDLLEQRKDEELQEE